ncbi:hypothetical protein [Nitratireductor sp. XY-223]|uniref:hypothetical protein n=1 Tax=Nitratireductor sp. XY-223 TaxID=2561926 RepID=UPI001FEEC4B7|nr:hypothetical protein [Nitratireductor sp. XY-223]
MVIVSAKNVFIGLQLILGQAQRALALDLRKLRRQSLNNLENGRIEEFEQIAKQSLKPLSPNKAQINRIVKLEVEPDLLIDFCNISPEHITNAEQSGHGAHFDLLSDHTSRRSRRNDEHAPIPRQLGRDLGRQTGCQVVQIGVAGAGFE